MKGKKEEESRGEEMRGQRKTEMMGNGKERRNEREKRRKKGVR